jgi:hypothetical protein
MSEHDLPGAASELPPMDDDALSLLRGGADLALVRDDARARLSARVMSSITALPGGGGSGGGPSGAPDATSKAASGLASLGTSSFVGMGLTFVLGAALGLGLRPYVLPDNVYSARTEASVQTPIPEQHGTLRTLERATSSEEGPSVAPPSAPSAKAQLPVRDLSAERTLLDGARAALGRGDPAAAAGLARTHEQRYPRGALAEEREALYVQALASSGKLPEARARAAKFKQTYPDSMLLPAVSAAIEAKGLP